MSSVSGTAQVGVFGLGIIGSIWASHFRADGILAGCWNRTPKPEHPGWTAEPGTLAQAADLLLICVADPSAVQSVLDVIEPSLGAGKTVVQSSTIDPLSARRFADRVEASGAHYVEAPFTGSKPAAEARETIFFLGGADRGLDAAEPVLGRISRCRLRMGTVEKACAIKLALNLQLAIQAEALSESLHFARSLGLEDSQYFQALEINAGRSGLTDLKAPKLLQRDYSPQFSIKHMHKDVRLALASLDPARLPLTAEVEGRFRLAVEQGWADQDFIALIRLLEKAPTDPAIA